MEVTCKKGEGSLFRSRLVSNPELLFKLSLKVLDDYQLDGQAVHQQEASFRISESDPLGEFSMFRVFPGSENTFRSSSEESGEELSPLLSKVSKL